MESDTRSEPSLADGAATGGGDSRTEQERDPLLEVKGLRVEFMTAAGWAAAVEGVTFELLRGEILGLVGESGCGKSATALALMGLLPPRGGRTAGGRILFESVDLLRLAPSRLRALRGDRLAMIFQEPMTALNPVLQVGEQVAEVLRHHRKLSRAEARRQTVARFAEVGIPDPEARFRSYPHQLSGGLRQRAMIAMAIACEPRLLIADEPTTALDVTIQAQVLALLSGLRERTGLSILLITHDLEVVFQTCSRVLVMYAGRIVESAPVRALFASPGHPYTHGLLASIPGTVTSLHEAGARLREIPGQVPPLGHRPVGCAFSDRCPRVKPRCREIEPDLFELAPGHRARCYYPHDHDPGGAR